MPLQQKAKLHRKRLWHWVAASAPSVLNADAAIDIVP